MFLAARVFVAPPPSACLALPCQAGKGLKVALCPNLTAWPACFPIDSQGFWEIVPRKLVSIFGDHELELLISGLPEIDVDDLRAHTDYQGAALLPSFISAGRVGWDCIVDDTRAHSDYQGAAGAAASRHLGV